VNDKSFLYSLLAWCFAAGCIGLSIGAWFDYRDTKTMGVGMQEIQSAKAECESSGRECAMIWEFVEVEADYQ
jgi:hypothetical protein